MKVWGNSKAVLICIATILLTFVIVSLFDIVIAVIYSRFYSDAAFIVTFGVGGIFAGVLGYMNGIAATTKTEAGRWILILLLIVAGVIFFFPLAAIEGGEYKAAFKAYGLTMGLSTFIFMKEKIE